MGNECSLDLLPSPFNTFLDLFSRPSSIFTRHVPPSLHHLTHHFSYRFINIVFTGQLLIVLHLPWTFPSLLYRYNDDRHRRVVGILFHILMQLVRDFNCATDFVIDCFRWLFRTVCF
jgi:hypothetical protein